MKIDLDPDWPYTLRDAIVWGIRLSGISPGLGACQVDLVGERVGTLVRKRFKAAYSEYSENPEILRALAEVQKTLTG